MRVIACIGTGANPDGGPVNKLEGEYRVLHFDTIGSLFEHSFSTPPDMILFSADDLDPDTVDVLSNIKSDPLCGHVPLVALTGDVEKLRAEPLRRIIDDYLLPPINARDISFRVALCMERATKTFELNPLTRLPGNITIIKEIQKRLDNHTVFALAYADIDFFKPFNDRYGFTRGDEVIRMVGRLIANIVKVRSPADGFVGHIGGDDFIFIVPFEGVEGIAAEVLQNLDSIIPSFYDSDERERGAIESLSREGVRMNFPLMCLSIGIAHNVYRTFSHYGELSEVASEMKKFAKKVTGSCFKIDRRRPTT